MKDKKPKIEPCIINSREGLEATVGDIVSLKIDAAAATAAMEAEIAEVQRKHQPKILDICRQIETKEAGVQIFCERNRTTLFVDKKSIETLLATVGFELTPWRVEKRNSKDTWEKIAVRLANLDWAAPFLREKPDEVDKSALLNARTTLKADQLAEAGIKFEHDEQFFIRPKSDVAADTVTESKEAA